MSRHQVSSVPPELQLDVTRLKVLRMWLEIRLERIDQFCGFQEVLPEILRIAMSYYRDAVRALLQLTRAYLTDDVVNACEGSYADDATDLTDFAKFICYYSIPAITKRSDITHAVIRSLVENVLCPYQLWINNFAKYQIKHKIAKVTFQARRNGIDNCFELYMEWLEEWCGGPYKPGEHFKHSERMQDKLRDDLEEIHSTISWLECAVKTLNDHGFRIAANSTWDSLDSEPPRESSPTPPVDRLKIISHRLACCRRICAFTEQVLIFCSSGSRFASLEDSQEGRTIELPTSDIALR